MRTLAIFGLGVFLAASVGIADAVPPPGPKPAGEQQQWDQFRLNAANDAREGGGLQVTWRVQTHGGFSSSPTLHDGHIIIGNNAGELFSFDAQTGAVDWTKRFPSSLMAEPIIYGDTLFLGVGDQQGYRMPDGHSMMVGSGTNELVALDPTTGLQRWTFPLAGTGMPTPAIVNGVLVHHDGAGYVVGLDPYTGTQVFGRDIGGIASMTAIMPVGGDRFVTTGYHKNALWELNSTDGATVWEHDFDQSDSGVSDCPPAGDDTTAYCDYIAPADGLSNVDVGNPGEMHAYAVNLRDGKLVWDVALESGKVPMWNEAAIPVVAHGLLFVGNSVAPYMHAIDAANGQMVWRTKVRGVVKSSVVCDGNAIYFGDLSGYLWALDRDDGHVIGVKNMHTSFNVGSPVIDGQTLVIGSFDGEVLALPLAEIRSSKDR